jgi:Protein of unknown function (DUF4127)
MKWAAVLLIAIAVAQTWADRVLLVPIDSRPAAGQFAQMIAHIAGEDLRMPPYNTLGRFTDPGSPDEILDWLEKQDLGQVDTLIISADMICYGGLIASRSNAVPAAVAVQRLRRLIQIHRKFRSTKLYVFSSTMRLAPTATREAMNWRMKLAKYEELKDRVERGRELKFKSSMLQLRSLVPVGQIERYEKARARDHFVQRVLVHLAAEREITYLVIGQDDAKPFGPHIREMADLHQEVRRMAIEGRVYFCEGIDQHASVLVSRALLKRAAWSPAVQIEYSDPTGPGRFASYETKPIKYSLEDQLVASGAHLVAPNERRDYILFVNTPKRSRRTFLVWLDRLKDCIDHGDPVAVADINLTREGIADSQLMNALLEKGRFMKLMGFAGWNTAGNTLGTVIPAANVYLYAKGSQVTPLVREVAQKEFLLHRYVDDYAYHRFTRPVAYSMILSEYHDEVYGLDYADLNDFVERDLQKQIDKAFETQFVKQSFNDGQDRYEIYGIDKVKIFLPWPRAYEVRLQFNLQARKLDNPELWP